MDTRIEKSPLFPATPQEWAGAYAEVTKSMDVPKIVSLASSQLTQFHSNGNPQRTVESVALGKELDQFYGRFIAAGKGITASDYSITQFSDHFATVRFTWEMSQVETSELLHRVNSSYLIRLEDGGWRFIGIIELGSPSGPQPTQ